MNRKPKPKVILYAPSIHTGGGTERILVNLGHALHEKGFDIAINVNTIGEHQLYEVSEDIQVSQPWLEKIRRVYSKSVIVKILYKLFSSFFLRIFLKKNCDREDTIILCFSTSVVLSCYEAGFSRNIIAYEHWPYWINSKNPKQKAGIQSIYPKLNLIIALTEHEKKVYEDLGCKNVIVIHNPYPFFPAEPALLEGNTVLSIGHFNEQKRRDLLVDAWKYVKRENNLWKLIIIGDGHQRVETVNQIKDLELEDSIEIVPPTKNVQKYYEESSLFVLSSEFESFSLVLLEAKTYGIPCASFDIVAGPSEVLRDGVDGVLVPFPDTERLAENISRLMNNEHLRKDFGKKARSDAERRFAPGKIYGIWEELLTGFVFKH